VLRALVLGFAAEICARLPWLGGGLPDRVLVTGELAECRGLTERLAALLEPLGMRLKVYAGDQEMAGLRDGALRVLRGWRRRRATARRWRGASGWGDRGRRAPRGGQPRCSSASTPAISSGQTSVASA